MKVVPAQAIRYEHLLLGRHAQLNKLGIFLSERGQRFSSSMLNLDIRSGTETPAEQADCISSPLLQKSRGYFSGELLSKMLRILADTKIMKSRDTDIFGHKFG